MNPDKDKLNELDWLLRDDLQGIRDQSFQKTLQAAKRRRRGRQALFFAPLIMILIGWVVTQRSWMPPTTSNRIASINLPETSPNTSIMDESPETAPKIRILTDHEFEEMIQGYPLAIIHRGGQTHYLPLEP